LHLKGYDYFISAILAVIPVPSRRDFGFDATGAAAVAGSRRLLLLIWRHSSVVNDRRRRRRVD